MHDLLRLGLIVADHYRHAIRRNAEEQLCELTWQVNATVRLGVARQAPGMQRNAAPRESLHVGHRRTVVDRRSMLFLLLQDRENPGGSQVTRSAGAYRGRPDQDTVAVNITPLFRDAD